MDISPRVLIVISSVLAILLVLSLYFGCRCKMVKATEGFTAVPEPQPQPEPIAPETSSKKEMFNTSMLNHREKELFDKIRDNSLPADQMDKLIGSGVLTKDVMDKFLMILGQAQS